MIRSIDIKRKDTREHLTEEFCNLFICFSAYSIFGWIYETIFCSVEAGHLVARGFLFGPYLPIYGFGAVLIIILLGKETSVPKLFIKSMIITSTLEYITATVLEVVFNKRWWDYSGYTFNFQGKICLLAAMAFGMFAVVLLKVFQPRFNKLIERFSMRTRLAVTKIGLVIMILDFVASVGGYKGL